MCCLDSFDVPRTVSRTTKGRFPKLLLIWMAHLSTLTFAALIELVGVLVLSAGASSDDTHAINKPVVWTHGTWR